MTAKSFLIEKSFYFLIDSKAISVIENYLSYYAVVYFTILYFFYATRLILAGLLCASIFFSFRN